VKRDPLRTALAESARGAREAHQEKAWAFRPTKKSKRNSGFSRGIHEQPLSKDRHGLRDLCAFSAFSALKTFVR
jgi:hypothetical protein